MTNEELVSEVKEPASEQEEKSSGRKRRAGFRTQRRAAFGINEESASEKK